MVRWKNLLSTGNTFTEIKLDSNNNTLIVGKNGSGKSTILDALCFGLFGKAFRNINKPSLLNSINDKDCIVEIEFDSEGKSYKVVRGIKPNVFEIYCNKKLLNQEASSRDYQEYFERFILKLNYKSFTQIVILGSASFVPFMQLSAADRRSIIEDLLDIQIFSTMNNLVKDRLSTNKESTANKKYEIELTQQKYDIHKKHLEEQKQDTEKKIENYVKEISIQNSIIQDAHANVSKSTINVEELQHVVNDKIAIETKLKKITKLESQIEGNLSKYKKDISFFQQNDDCPTCRQEISVGVKEQEISKLTHKVEESESGLKELEKKILIEQESLNKISNVQKQIQELQIKIATNNTLITETNKYISKIQKQIDELNKNKSNSNDNENDLNRIKNDLNKYENELKTLIEEKSYYEVATTLLKDTGIKTKIIKQYLPIINKLVNKYLTSLDFFVNINLDESFKETIKSRHRDEFSYNNFSEGEKQRIDMALMLTWRAIAKLKNSANTNLLILDEIFDASLDATGTEELMKILHLLEDVNLFVISHRGDILQDKFSNVIRFDKIKNFSRIIK
jgi:DNA repair exonuclease SbcCD ATPase subunit